MRVKGRVIPEEQVAMVGRSVRFICLSLEEVKWEHNQDMLPSNAVPRKGYGDMEYWLDINEVTRYNWGAYRCFGRNDKVFFYSDGRLNVTSKLLTKNIISRNYKYKDT